MTERTLQKLRKTGKTRQQGLTKTCAMDDNIDALTFFCSEIFIHKLNIITKERVISLQIFSAAILPNIVTRCSAIAEKPRCRVH